MKCLIGKHVVVQLLLHHVLCHSHSACCAADGRHTIASAVRHKDVDAAAVVVHEPFKPMIPVCNNGLTTITTTPFSRAGCDYNAKV